jgi:hypothetical protein
MKCLVKEPVRGRRDGQEIRIGIASWDTGDSTSFSIKYTWFDSRGRAARGGGVPIDALEQMLAFARRHQRLWRRR